MPTNTTMQPSHSGMNASLWIMQVLWGIFFAFTGFGKILCIDQTVWSHTLPRVPWFSAVPQALFVFIGLCEFLGGVGLILPGITGIKPKLTPLAALGLTVIMALAAIFHIVRGEYNVFIPLNLVLGGVAAFIACGRWFVRPIAPARATNFRLVTGVVVLVALAFVGFAPVWYQLTHIN